MEPGLREDLLRYGREGGKAYDAVEFVVDGCFGDEAGAVFEGYGCGVYGVKFFFRDFDCDCWMLVLA